MNNFYRIAASLITVLFVGLGRMAPLHGQECGSVQDPTGCKNKIGEIQKLVSAISQSSQCHAGPSKILSSEWAKNLGALAKCPAGSGFRPLSSLHPPAAVVIGRIGSLVDGAYTVMRLWEIGQLLKPSPKMIVVVDEYKKAEFQNLLTRYLSSADVSAMTFVSTSGETMWAQDFMELGVKGPDSSPAVLGLPYGRAPQAGKDVAQSCEYGFVPSEVSAREGGAPSGDYGGNIEAFPGNVVVVGDTMGTGLRSKLKAETGEEPLIVKTRWLEVGHVDELFNVVPTQG